MPSRAEVRHRCCVNATKAELARWQHAHYKAQGWLDQLERSRGLLLAALPQAERALVIAQGELVAIEQQARRDLGRAELYFLLEGLDRLRPALRDGPRLVLGRGVGRHRIERQLPAYPFKTPRLIFRNLGEGKFEELIEEAGPGVAAAHASRGCAFGDFDNDGDLDVLILNMNEPPSLLRNDVSGNNHWLKVLLEGTKSNRAALGATVIASYGGRKQAQAVLAQSSYLSVNDRRLHFGLGPEESVDLEIRWPSGAQEKISGVAADRLVITREGAGIIRAETWPHAH